MIRLLLRALLCLVFAMSSARADPTTCVGKFPNPITDVCWSCILPISIGAFPLLNYNGQEDNGDNPPIPICSCGMDPMIGLSVGWWEPLRIVEAVRKPFCMVSLGGVDLGAGIATPEGGRRRQMGTSEGIFYQAHFYSAALVTWLNVVTDWACAEGGTFDVMYMTEVDPLWNDDQMTAILEPEALLFANPVGVLSCAADCVKASVGFGFKEMFWCAGCQGMLYPLNGNIAAHLGGVESGELITQRVTAKLHRQMMAEAGHGTRGLCGTYIEPLMDKTAYKTQLLYPIPGTGKFGGLDQETKSATSPASSSARPTPPVVGLDVDDGSDPVPAPGPGSTIPLSGNRCCQPFGRSTVIYGAGKEYPVKGEDFAFLLFRKRNCCVGY